MRRKAKTKKSVVSLFHRENVPGSPNRYRSVGVIKEMIKEAVDYLGGLQKFVHPGDKVAIKPNVFWPIGPETALVTDPRVVEALVLLIREAVPKVKEIVVWEAAASCYQVWDGELSHGFKKAGYTKMAKKVGVRLIDGEYDEFIPTEVPDAWYLRKPGLPKTLLEADCYLSVPKLKTHNEAVMTGAIKNQQGCLKSTEKARYHANDLHGKLVDIYRALKPDLTIVDALWVLQGQGPLSFFSEDLMKDMNVILAGTDAVALDAVGSTMMGIDPKDVPTCRIGAYEGLGIADLEDIIVRGTPVDEVKRVFKRSSPEIEALYPNVRVYQHGSCQGCTHALRFGLDRLAAMGTLAKLDRPINLVIGFNTEVPPDIDWERTLVIGDCTRDHMDKARVFFPGCPHLGAASSVSTVIESIINGTEMPDFHYLTPNFKPLVKRK